MKARLVYAAALASGLLLAACQPAGDTAPDSSAQSTAAANAARPARINGHPNLNGVWQALNTAHWNLEGGSAHAVPELWRLGALFAVPPGQSVIEGGTIPYLPEALEQRNKNRANWPAADPETKCYRAGIPRSTYMPYPFQIVQGDGDMMFIYEYATSSRTVRMSNHLNPQEVLVDQWLGWSNGRWEGDTLVIDVFGQIRDTWLDRAGNHHAGMTVEERYTPMTENHIWYEATITDPRTFSRPWKIAMPLYRRMEPNAEIFEYKCVEFAEPLLYGELLKEPIK
jgi:hypothetical protein